MEDTTLAYLRGLCNDAIDDFASGGAKRTKESDAVVTAYGFCPSCDGLLTDTAEDHCLRRKLHKRLKYNATDSTARLADRN